MARLSVIDNNFQRIYVTKNNTEKTSASCAQTARASVGNHRYGDVAGSICSVCYTACKQITQQPLSSKRFERVGEQCGCEGFLLFDNNRFDIDELLDAMFSQFTTIS